MGQPGQDSVTNSRLPRWTLLVLLQLVMMMDANPTDVPRVCGKQGSMNRIVGGNDSRAGEWPWQVSIRNNDNHICGGSLIADQWVVTASHCFIQYDNPTDMSVLLGALKLSDPGPHSVKIAVSRLHRNPIFSEKLGTGDIALVELEHPVNFTNQIIPICLPDANVTFPEGYKCWVTGWGNLGLKGVSPLLSSDILQKLEVPIISTNTCSALYHRETEKIQDKKEVKSGMICAGFPTGGRDSCQGDSGGPLACMKGDSWLLAGVVSWGDGCALANRPGVYTEISHYVSWIQKEINWTATVKND